MNRRTAIRFLAAVSTALAGIACNEKKIEPITVAPPDVSPHASDAGDEGLLLNRDQINPMYTELHAIDLPTVIRVAVANNFEIQRARQAVVAAEGNYESAVGSAFPAIVPGAFFQRRDGRFENTDGRLFNVGVSSFSASIAIDWIINPGQIIYNILAARKRLEATEHREDGVTIDTLRLSAVQYYDLALAQARIEAEDLGVKEAEELLRIEQVRLRTGAGVKADALRAQARLAERQQDLIIALQLFYRASVELATTLHLDATITLVPRPESLPPVALVRDSLDIDDLIGIAVAFRPDMKSVRELINAAMLDRKRTWWAGWGPEFAARYEYGGITAHANNVVPGTGIPSNLIVNPNSPTGAFSSNPVANGLIKEGILRGSRAADPADDQTYSFSDFHHASVGARWRLTIETFGRIKTAEALESDTVIRAEQLLDIVRKQVVNLNQSAIANRQLIGLARQQITSAEEALRLTEANLKAGTMTTLDVLQAQDAAIQARLRYAEAVVQFNQSQINLLAALGLLEPQSLMDEAEFSSDTSSTIAIDNVAS